MNKIPAKAAPSKLAAFKQYLNNTMLFAALIGLLVCELGIWLGVYFLEINVTNPNWIITALDFIVSFRFFPIAAMFVIYGVAAYTIVKLGTRHATFQIVTMLVYSLLTMFIQAFESLVAAAYSYGSTVTAVLPEFLQYMGQNIGYWLGSIALVLIPPLLLLWLCVVFAADYRAKKQNRTLKEKQKNPMPRIYFWLVIVWSILQLVSAVPQSISDYQSLGFFQNFSEAFSFFEPYLEIVVFGVGGYFLMRLVAFLFRRKATALIGKAEAEEPVAETD